MKRLRLLLTLLFSLGFSAPAYAQSIYTVGQGRPNGTQTWQETTNSTTCTFAASTTCNTITALAMGSTFSQAPICEAQKVSDSGTTLLYLPTLTVTYNAGTTTVAVPLTASASNSNTVGIAVFCVGGP